MGWDWSGAMWLLLAVTAGLAGYAAYLAGLGRHRIQPSRASWLVWSLAAAAEAATYAAINPHGAQRWAPILGAGACVAVTAAVWRGARWTRPSTDEIVCVGAFAAALVLWLAFREALWAHMLLVAALPVSFWPTWASVRTDPRHERTPAWGLWTIGDLATVLAATRTGGHGIAAYAYLLVELACHASVWLAVGLPSLYTWRSLPRHRLRAVDPRFRIGETALGKAVFAAQPFAEGELVVRFSGPSVGADRLPRPLTGRHDRFVQVSADRWMGPSGAVDDLINHSCRPNTGLRFSRGAAFLVALRPIAVGEEIAWDYSTTLGDPSWQMLCGCGAPDCRGVIGAFATLSPERQEWYRARNLVAPYLRRRDSVWRPERAA